MKYIKDLSSEVTIEHNAELGIILEKSYTIELAYDYLNNIDDVKDLEKVLNPIWGEYILYFTYKSKKYVVLSAKGASIAANAVERIRRTGGKALVSIGTCGSTDESIEDGTFLVVSGAIRNEGVTKGYLDLKVPCTSDSELSLSLTNALKKSVKTINGYIFTTDNRYQEDPVELKFLTQHAKVVAVDMETSAILLISMYHNIKASTIKIITDCAVKETDGELKGIFDRNKDFVEFVHPKLKIAIQVALNVLAGSEDNV